MFFVKVEDSKTKHFCIAKTDYRVTIFGGQDDFAVVALNNFVG